jgi:hypothetical protein
MGLRRISSWDHNSKVRSRESGWTCCKDHRVPFSLDEGRKKRYSSRTCGGRLVQYRKVLDGSRTANGGEQRYRSRRCSSFSTVRVQNSSPLDLCLRKCLVKLNSPGYSLSPQQGCYSKHLASQSLCISGTIQGCGPAITAHGSLKLKQEIQNQAQDCPGTSHIITTKLEGVRFNFSVLKKKIEYGLHSV